MEVIQTCSWDQAIFPRSLGSNEEPFRILSYTGASFVRVPPMVTTVTSSSSWPSFEDLLMRECNERTEKMLPRKLPKDVLANNGRSVGRQLPMSAAAISIRDHATIFVFSP
jgi:hypothetical protein